MKNLLRFLAVLIVALFAIQSNPGPVFANSQLSKTSDGSRLLALGDDRWRALLQAPPGIDGEVFAVAAGLHGELYVGGKFTWAGGVRANNVARWDGAAWSALGGGILGDGAQVNALAVTAAGKLFVGGVFSRANGNPSDNLVAWDGKKWVPVGTGVNSNVTALAGSGSNVYVGGIFTLAGGKPAKQIARWNDSTKVWSAMGAGLTACTNCNTEVYAIAVSGSSVYVGGSFTDLGAVKANHIAVWNGKVWAPLGDGVGSYGTVEVRAIALDGTKIYVGGRFTSAGGAGAQNLAEWDGTNWSPFAGGTLSDLYPVFPTNHLPIHAIAVSGGKVYVGGEFTYDDDEGGTGANIIGWDSASGQWFSLGATNGAVAGLTMIGDSLFGAGAFTHAGNALVGGVARWNESAWSALGTADVAVDGHILTVAANGDDVYVGGKFTSIGGIAANNIARWNRVSGEWSALGDGLQMLSHAGWEPSVSVIVPHEGSLYVAGDFDTAGGMDAWGIARWNGAAWEAMGSGLGLVSAIAFDSADSVYAAHLGGAVEKWNGTDWVRAVSTRRANGYPSTVTALLFSGDEMYIGGRFDLVEDVPATYIAHWTPAAGWSALGSGLDGVADERPVRAMALKGADLYVAGSFDRAGGVGVNNVARWDGAAWHALGDGVNGDVSAFVSVGDIFHAGGNFRQAGISTVNGIAAWDGSRWLPLGGGLSPAPNWNGPQVLSLSASGNDLFVAGDFSTIGNQRVHDPARWDATPPLPAPSPVMFEENDRGVAFDGWQGLFAPWASGMSVRMSNHTGDTVKFRFGGTSLVWLTHTGPDQGNAGVKIDGVAQPDVNLYSATDLWYQKQTFSGLTNAGHTIEIKVLGTQDPNATDSFVTMDAFIVGTTKTEETASTITFNTWTSANGANASGKTYRWSKSKGATITFSSRGSAISWVTSTGPGNGQAEVFVDGFDKGMVELYSKTAKWQVLKTFDGLSSDEVHTIEIHVLGTKSRLSGGTRVVVDGFQVTP